MSGFTKDKENAIDVTYKIPKKLKARVLEVEIFISYDKGQGKDGPHHTQIKLQKLLK